MDHIEALKYPIGQYQPLENYEPEMQHEWIAAIENLPSWVEAVVENLDEFQLNTPYRPEGWTVAQVVHHLADSHMNAYIRMKLALTEEHPTIKPYDEKSWAILPDIEHTPINVSITLLHALHKKWGLLLRNLNAQDWERSYYHPEHEEYFTLYQVADIYAWHGRHHMEQIRKLKERKGW